MPQHHHQTFNQRGELIEEIVEDYEEPQPRPRERAKEKIRNANSVPTLRTAMLEYIESGDDDDSDG